MDKKRTVEELKTVIRDTPQQDVAPLLEELREAEAAEQAKQPKPKEHA